MTKILFLDIDGVLNRFSMRAEFHSIEPELAHRLHMILLATDAEIVVSSTWRYLIINQHFSCEGFAYLLKTHGVALVKVVGHTGESGPSRGEEIWAWLKAQAKRPERYCILDNDSSGMGMFGDRFVQVDSRCGLQDEQVARAIEVLGRE